MPLPLPRTFKPFSRGARFVQSLRASQIHQMQRSMQLSICREVYALYRVAINGGLAKRLHITEHYWLLIPVSNKVG